MALLVAAAAAGCRLPLAGRNRPQRAPPPSRAVTSDTAAEKVNLGGSRVAITKLGIGAWSWGDTTYWNDFQWDDRKMKAAKGAFDASIDCGIRSWEPSILKVYSEGISCIIAHHSQIYEKLAQRCVVRLSLPIRFIKERQQQEQVEVSIATKFAALPWRFGRGSVLSALKDSLSRLGVSSVELYQLHWPGLWGNEGYLDGLGDAYEQGLVKAVGVSNYSGVLTGKYTPDNPPTGPRGRIYTPEFLTKLQPLLTRIKEIGESYGKTRTQVVLNWLVCQGNVVPIPGARNAEQATEFAGAVGWSLTDQEVDELRSLAREIKPVIGFPVEKL